MFYKEREENGWYVMVMVSGGVWREVSSWMKVNEDDHGQNGCGPRKILWFLCHEYHTLRKKKIIRETLN